MAWSSSPKFPYYLKNLSTGWVCCVPEDMTVEQAIERNERLKRYVSDHIVWTDKPDENPPLEVSS